MPRGTARSKWLCPVLTSSCEGYDNNNVNTPKNDEIAQCILRKYTRLVEYSILLNSQPRIMQFYLSDWLTRSRLSAIIPAFYLIWETSAASAAQFKNFPAGSESSIRKMANLARFISLYKK